MRVPKFWAVVEGTDTDPTGERFLYRRVWGWSMSSATDALAVAQERLRAVLAQVQSDTRVGAYYPRVPLREPILDEVVVDGEQAFVVTRNRYGAEILNTDRLLIADIDLPSLSDPPPSGGLLRRLFGRASTPDPLPEPPLVVERLGVLKTWAYANPDLGVIVYRTASGMRVFVTGVDSPVTSARGSQILADLGADPIYVELCRAHGTFRARLTPKPWRLPRPRAPRDRWPFVNDRAERRFQRWLDKYQDASREHAVCRRLFTYGLAPSALEQQIIQLHDDRTLVTARLPLA